MAVGNSITLHGVADYWWDDDRGMAASRDERDYVHLVSAAIGAEGAKGVTHALNFSAWEANGHDRSEFLPLLDPYLSTAVDLVTLQLGENAADLETYEADWEELIAYVKEGAPNAQVVVVGDFWSNGDRDALKERACAAEQVIYVSLEGIRDNPDYQAGLGAEVEDADGDMRVIEHSGVAKHPGDAGMAAITERVVAASGLEDGAV